ncbi:uncharacterized protein LOC135715036 [Ochlerotatus camptorhynchus]|uniref:uncharacterized protein LOC135715036 n=1 Tax=Ochlerotatus camptorhynchus TaxID=644619 RepID=UPI0031D68FE0
MTDSSPQDVSGDHMNGGCVLNIFTYFINVLNLSIHFRKKKTNTRQFACIVAFMEENPDIAKGNKVTSSRESVTSLWWTLTDSLNSLGPPTCCVAAWQKVWTDKKLQIKHKLQHNKKELRATGGGPNTLKSFNDLEETIIRLLSLESAVNHNGSVFGTLPCVEEPRVTENEPMHDDAARADETEGGLPAVRGRGRATKRNYRKVLLEKQTDDLSKMNRHVLRFILFFRVSKEIFKYLRKSTQCSSPHRFLP